MAATTDISRAVSVRDAVPADLTRLVSLARKTFVDKFGHLYQPADLAAFLAEAHTADTYRALIADPKVLLRVAETQKGELAAYLVCGPLSLPAENAPPGSVELKRLYVDQPLQGYGLGSRFIEETLNWAQACGSPEIYLSVFSENIGAQKLYARYGWQKVGEFMFPVGDHEDLEFLMRLKL